VINLQHRQPPYLPEAGNPVDFDGGFLVGAESRWHGWRSKLQSVGAIADAQSVGARQGILQRELGLSEEHAYLALQRQSRQKRQADERKLPEAIVLSDEVERELPDSWSFVNLP